MGLITGALEIGKSALLSYQSALQVVGNNVSNAGSPDYTRQSPVLTPKVGINLPEGYAPGGGVALTGLARNIDESIQNRLRYATANQQQANTEQQVLGRIESVLNELTDTDLSTLMESFFNSFYTLQNQPHDSGSRQVVVNSAKSLIGELQRQRDDLLALRNELNDEIEMVADRAGELVDEVARLNVQIVELEATGQGGANALRDQRDGLLTELSKLMAVETREQPDGSLNVYVGNQMLIQAGISRGVTTTLDLVDQEPQVNIRFADNNSILPVTTGRLAGLQAARDSHVMGQVDELNSLASSIIQEVNKLHVSGQGATEDGMLGYTDVTGTYAVDDTTVALNTSHTGLDLVPQNGSFLVTMTDESGARTTTTVTVDLDGIGADDSLDSLVAQINANVANLNASITPDNKLNLQADSGYEVTFSEDTSHVLAALGVNTFFDGSDAQDISINEMIDENPSLIAAATIGTVGDGSNAGAIADLSKNSIEAIGDQSLIELYNTISTKLAVKGSAAMSSRDAAQSIVSTLQAQRESVSGVSLDEETVALLKLERSFQGAARFTSVVDGLIQEILSMVR